MKTVRSALIVFLLLMLSSFFWGAAEIHAGDWQRFLYAGYQAE
jgi:hypothetical protein